MFGERRISALVFPCVASLILSAYITVSVLQTRPAYGVRMMTAALVDLRLLPTLSSNSLQGTFRP